MRHVAVLVGAFVAPLLVIAVGSGDSEATCSKERRFPVDGVANKPGAAMMQVSYLQEAMAHATKRGAAAPPPHAGPSEMVEPRCTATSPYIKAQANQQCKKATTKEENVESVAACYELCQGTSDCHHFAYSESTQVCQTCKRDAGFASAQTSNVYAMCIQQLPPDPTVCLEESTIFKFCSAFSLPHYSETFFDEAFDFMGVGAYKLAGTKGGSFELHGYQCPYRSHAATFAGLAWKSGGRVVSVIGDVVAVDGQNISRAGVLLDPSQPMPSGVDVTGSPSTGVLFQSADKCVSLRAVKKASVYAGGGYFLNQQVRIAEDFVGQVGVCGDLAAKSPVLPEHSLFTPDELVRLCQSCGLQNCEPDYYTGYPNPTVPISHVTVAGFEAACTQAGIEVAQAKDKCKSLEVLGVVYYEACMYDYCSSGGEDYMVEYAKQAQVNDEELHASLMGPKAFTNPPLPPVPVVCTPVSPFAFDKINERCPDNGPSFLFKMEGVASPQDCYEECKRHTNCSQFAWGAEGEYTEGCIGCKAANWVKEDGMKGYKVCPAKPPKASLVEARSHPAPKLIKKALEKSDAIKLDTTTTTTLYADAVTVPVGPACAAGADFEGPVVLDQKCPNTDDRVFKYTATDALRAGKSPMQSEQECYEMCLTYNDCNRFSYAYSGQYVTMCIGCKTSWAGEPGFGGYLVCSRQPTPTTPAPSTTTVSTTTVGPSCAAGDPYEDEGENLKCPQNGQRLFRREETPTREECYQACLTTQDCVQFSYADSSHKDFPNLCIACKTTDWDNHNGFKPYRLCGTAKPSTSQCSANGYNVCGAWGDPHYRQTFFNKKFDFQGLGIYKLAATIGGDFTMQAFQCPFRRRAATFAGFAIKMGYTTVTIIEDTIAVNGTNISDDGVLIDPSVPMPEAEFGTSGTPAAGLNLWGLDGCVNLFVKKRTVSSSPVGYVFDQKLRIANDFVGMVGLCGDESDRNPVFPENSLFTSDEMTKLCQACGLEGCEASGGNKPDISKPTNYVAIADVKTACEQSLMTETEARNNCSAGGVRKQDLEDDCAMDFCLSGGDPSVVMGALQTQIYEDMANELFITGTTTSTSPTTSTSTTTKKKTTTTLKTTTTTASTSPSGECGPASLFVLSVDGLGCFPESPDVLYNGRNASVSECYETCLQTPGCQKFSFADAGDMAQVCYGCTADSHMVEMPGMKSYNMCAPPQSSGGAPRCDDQTEYKLCTVAGDPHYHNTFYGGGFDLQGLGVYRLAGTKGGDFELHSFNCPIGQYGAGLAGLAWKIGGTVVTLINDTIAINYTNHTSEDLPSGSGITMNEPKYSFTSNNHCIRAHATRYDAASGQVGYVYNHQLQIAADLIAGVGLCGDETARDPVSVDSALFSADQLVSLCQACGLKDCEAQNPDGYPLEMAAPISYDPMPNAFWVCVKTGHGYDEAVTACADVGPYYKEACLFDYCSKEADESAVAMILDAEEEDSKLGGNHSKAIWIPADVDKGSKACTISPYHLRAVNKGCDPDTALFHEYEVANAAHCYEKCLAYVGSESCSRFSYSGWGIYQWECFGCTSELPWKSRPTFKAYDMCEQPVQHKGEVCASKTCKFKVCSGWGDPHFTQTFFGQAVDNEGLGVFKLASTMSGDFQLQGFQCPFRNHSAAFAGFAWSDGETIISLIGDTLSVQGEALLQNGQVINPEATLPVQLQNLKYNADADSLSYETEDTCVMLRVQKVVTQHSSAGYFYNQQVRIAEDYAGQMGLCGDAAAQGQVSVDDNLFTGDQMVQLCTACGLRDCEKMPDGFPQFSEPLGYVAVRNPQEACQMTGTSFEDATTACAGFNGYPTFEDACIHDYCAAYGDVAMANNAKQALMEENAMVQGPGVLPFRWLSHHDAPTAESDKQYKDTVTGLCAKVKDIAVRDVEDCSPMVNYTCDVYSNGTAHFLEDGVTLRLLFEGNVSQPAEACGEAEGGCEWWTKYKSCSGPSAQTETAPVMGGQCVRWEMETPLDVRASDWYEYFVGLYREDGELLDYRFQRGLFMLRGWYQFEVPETANVYVKVNFAAYDSNGDYAVGAAVDIRNMIHGPCLAPSQLEGPEDCVVNGNTAALNEDGYFMLAECCCALEMDVFIQRAMAYLQLEECRVGSIWGLVPYYTCVHGSQSWAQLMIDLYSTYSDAMEDPKKENCIDFAPIGQCPEQQSDSCVDFNGPGSEPGPGTGIYSEQNVPREEDKNMWGVPGGMNQFDRPACGRFR